MIIMEWSGKYAPEGAGFMYLCTVLMFVLHTTIINKIIIKNNITSALYPGSHNEFESVTIMIEVLLLVIYMCLRIKKGRCKCKP